MRILLTLVFFFISIAASAWNARGHMIVAAIAYQELTAEQHHRIAEILTQHRHQTLQRAYLRHPERFVKGEPQPLQPPAAVWINKPADDTSTAIDAGKEVASEVEEPGVFFPAEPIASGNPHRARKASENHINSEGAQHRSGLC